MSTEYDHEELREFATSDNLDLTPQNQQRAWELLPIALGEIERLRSSLATVRKRQMAAVIGARFSWQINEEKSQLTRPPSIHADLAARSKARADGAVMVLQELLEVLGEIEGDEECEAAWKVVEVEMHAGGAQ